MIKFRFFLDKNKEEKWLNEMANNGYQLDRVSFGYSFNKTKPYNTNIRIDYRTFKNNSDFTNYKTLFEDSGWHHISGTKGSGFQYFKNLSESSSDDIFSDQLSRAGRYKRISDMWMNLAISFLPILVTFMLTDMIQIEAITNPKSLYLTPGLWDKTGIDFWWSFLWETPFALGRGFLWLFIPITIGLYLLCALKSQFLYKKEIKSL